jgi:CheY-like chemotaxis protein
LLGGSIAVKSALGSGSTFSVTIPVVYKAAGQPAIASIQPGRVPVLVVEDSDEDLMIFERILSNTRFQVVAARSIAAATTALDVLRPAAIVLDLRLQGQEAWDFITRLKREERTANIPIVVVSTIDDRQKGFALGAAAYGLKPVDKRWLIETLERLAPQRRVVRVLIVDDEETYRFIAREMLSDSSYAVSEAGSGMEGLQLTHELVPDIVLLDLRLTDMTGIEMCERLRRDPKTAQVPVILVTSQMLSPDERERFGVGRPVLSKSALTRDALRTAIHDTLGQPRTNLPEVRA